MKTLTAMMLGGMIVYFLDPASGRERRARARRGVESLLNVSRRAAVETGRPGVAEAIGKVQRTAEGERAESSPVIVPGS